MPVPVPACGDRRRTRRSLRLAIGLAVLAAIGTESVLTSAYPPMTLAASSVTSGTHGTGPAYRGVAHQTANRPTDAASRTTGSASAAKLPDAAGAAQAGVPPIRGEVARPHGDWWHIARGRRAPPSRHA